MKTNTLKMSYSARKLLLLSCLCLLTAVASAQNLTVTGTVSDDEGTMPGVTVVETGTTTGTMTDADGHFKIHVSKANSSLTFTSVGYEKQIVALRGKSILKVKMTVNAKLFNEVVAIGYGSQKRRDLTGAIATIDANAIGNQTVQSAAQALQGKMAGVQMTNSGAPGSSPQFRIRGVGTVTDGSNPLFVVDGVIVDNIDYLGPNDIANIAVLKDASSTAIYGVKAAGGVILVTTKQGQYDGKPTVSFNTYGGYKTPSNLVDMADGPDYITLFNEKMQETGSDKRLDPAKFSSHNYLNDLVKPSWTNSQDLNVSGGSKTVRYSFGIRHLQDDGLINKNDFSRLGFRGKVDVNVTKHIRVGFNAILESAKSRPVNSDVILQAYRALPVYDAHKPDGSWTDPNVDNISGTMPNPTAANNYDNQWQTSIDRILSGYVEFDFLKDFTFKTSLSQNTNSIRYISFTPIYKVSEFQHAEKNSMSKSRTENSKVYWDNTLTYQKTLAEDHHLKVMIGTSYQNIQSDFLQASVEGIQDLPAINPSYLFLSWPKIDKDYLASVNDNGDRQVTMSYMGRLSYDYQNKYLLNFTAREDGSTKFPSYNRWGFFPSVGVGWVASEEDFIRKNFPKINFLKVRASWGSMGNENVPVNLYVPNTNTSDYKAVIFGPGQNTANGTVMYPATITDMFNPNLKWETTYETDLGIDLNMFRSRLNATFDFYSKTTKNAVFPIMPLGSSGLGATGVYGNNADINNTGFELSLGWSDKIKDFSYSVSGNLTYNKNKLTRINSIETNGIYGKYSDSPIITYSTLGNPIGSFYGYNAVGVFQNDQQIASMAHLPGAKPGDLIYQDINGDHVIDDRDRTFIGNPNPPVFYGFNVSLGYKHFDLNVGIQGVAGNKIFNANRMFRYGTENFDQDFVDHRWHGEGTSDKYPSAAWNNPTTPSSFYVEDGSYVRIKSIQLGYTIPKQCLSRLHISQLRFYVNAENPFTFTKYNGFSPEVPGSTIMTGVDRNAYPLSSVYSLGMNLSF